MNKESLLQIVGKAESLNIEWKPSLSQLNEIIEAVAGFSNTEGGRIVVGVAKSGKLQGIEIGKDTMERLTNQISQNTDPKVYPRLTVETIGDKNIVVIEVKESSDRLTLAFGRPFKRIGKSTIRMSKDEYERLILKKHKEEIRFDGQICEGANFKDIDDEKITQFLKKAQEVRNLGISVNVSTSDALEKLNLLKGKKLTNAAVLLFGRDPQEFFLQTEVRCAKFKGDESVKPLIDMKVFRGNIIDQVNKAFDFILEHIPMKVYMAGRPEREERYEYPPDALREALINAVCHRDYKSAGHIQVRIFDSRIEVWNPGLLPEPLTLEDLKKEHKSIPRNPLIAKSFFLIKFIEQWGTGTNDMISMCLNWKLPEPLFEYITGDFVVTFKTGALTNEQIEKIGLNIRQKKALEYIGKHNKISKTEYIKLNGISNATAKRDLRIMVDKSILLSQGNGPETYYVVSRYEPI